MSRLLPQLNVTSILKYNAVLNSFMLTLQSQDNDKFSRTGRSDLRQWLSAFACTSESSGEARLAHTLAHILTGSLLLGWGPGVRTCAAPRELQQGAKVGNHPTG